MPLLVDIVVLASRSRPLRLQSPPGSSSVARHRMTQWAAGGRLNRHWSQRAAGGRHHHRWTASATGSTYTAHPHPGGQHRPLQRTWMDVGGAGARDGVLPTAPRLLAAGHRSSCCTAGGRARGDLDELDTSSFPRHRTPPSPLPFLTAVGIRLCRHHRGAAWTTGHIHPQIKRRCRPQRSSSSSRCRACHCSPSPPYFN